MFFIDGPRINYIETSYKDNQFYYLWIRHKKTAFIWIETNVSGDRSITHELED